jgi:hypothetical protein
MHSFSMPLQNMPKEELKHGRNMHDTFMKPLVEECVGAGKPSDIVDQLVNDEQYKWVRWCCCHLKQQRLGRTNASCMPAVTQATLYALTP